MFIGEEKHGMWRFQENGFIRVYRDNSTNVGILIEEREKAIESGLNYVDAEKYPRNDALLSILKINYMNVDPYQDFDYAFGDETSIITNEDGREVEVFNWIDLPIYHEKFTRKYANHVPIDTPSYYCQVMSFRPGLKINNLLHYHFLSPLILWRFPQSWWNFLQLKSKFPLTQLKFPSSIQVGRKSLTRHQLLPMTIR